MKKKQLLALAALTLTIPVLSANAPAPQWPTFSSSDYAYEISWEYEGAHTYDASDYVEYVYSFEIANKSDYDFCLDGLELTYEEKTIYGYFDETFIPKGVTTNQIITSFGEKYDWIKAIPSSAVSKLRGSLSQGAEVTDFTVLSVGPALTFDDDVSVHGQVGRKFSLKDDYVVLPSNTNAYRILTYFAYQGQNLIFQNYYYGNSDYYTTESLSLLGTPALSDIVYKKTQVLAKDPNETKKVSHYHASELAIGLGVLIVVGFLLFFFIGPLILLIVLVCVKGSKKKAAGQ